MKIIKITAIAATLLFYGCDSKSDEATKTDCLAACKANWSPDQIKKCPELITDIQSACLETGTASCKIPIGGTNVVGPLPLCDNPSPQTSDGKSSTFGEEKNSVRFNVIKIDLTKGGVYNEKIAKLKADYPTGAIYLPSTPTTPKFSYHKFLRSIHSSPSITPDQFKATKIVNITSYKDAWHEPTVGEEVISGVDDCGNRVPITNTVHVSFDDARDAVPRWDYDWAVTLFKKHPAIKEYNYQYKQWYGFPFTPAIYIMNTRGAFTRRNKEGTCISKDLDYELLEALKKDDLLKVIPLSTPTESQAHFSTDVSWITLGEAMAYNGVHTPVIALYMNNITNPQNLQGTTCSDWQDLFATTLSHELGHFLFGAGHAIDKTMLMAAVNTCQSEQAFPYMEEIYNFTQTVSRPYFVNIERNTSGIYYWMP